MDSSGNRQCDAANAWMTSSFVLAFLLFASLVWNGVLSTMTVRAIGSSGTNAQVEQGQGAELPSPLPEAPPEVADVSADDDAVLGDPAAPVEMVFFSDFQCGYCGRFFADSFERLREEYISSGKVKLISRDYPLRFTSRSLPAAIAAECVRDLSDDDTYFDYQVALFLGSDLSDASLAAVGTEMGVSQERFVECLADADGSRAEEVRADHADGVAAGVNGTPTFFVNGRRVVGAQPYEVFKALIDSELEDASGRN